ncbi:MAG: DMT family transporter [Candidatus Thermoplasmatota archaeon]
MFKKKENTATLFLLLGVFFWGTTFVFIKEAVGIIDVFSFNSIRFFISSIFLSVIFIKRFKNFNYDILKKGFVIGLVLAFSFIFQTIGIRYTSVSNAAFITGLNVVFVLIFVSFLDKTVPDFKNILAVLLAFIGLSLLTLNVSSEINIGDLWVLTSAVLFGVHLIMISRVIGDIDVPSFTITQLFTVGTVTGILGFIFNGEIIFSDNLLVWRAILFCGILATAYTFIVQASLQRYLSEVKAAIIFSFEPIFAALIAFIYLGEILSLRQLFGGFLILLAMFIAKSKIESGKEKYYKKT